MTVEGFIKACETNWAEPGKSIRLSSEQLATLLEKLQQFSEKQLREIYDRLLESSRPGRLSVAQEIGRIFSIAGELGFLAHTEEFSTVVHTWKPTDCKLCEGEGRISVIFLWSYSVTSTGGRCERQEIRRIFPYSSHARVQYDTERDEYEGLFRCSCESGNARTIPRSWPRWKNPVKTSSQMPVLGHF